MIELFGSLFNLAESLFSLVGLVLLTLYGAMKLFGVQMGLHITWTEYALAWVAFFAISFLFTIFAESS